MKWKPVRKIPGPDEKRRTRVAAVTPPKQFIFGGGANGTLASSFSGLTYGADLGRLKVRARSGCPGSPSSSFAVGLWVDHLFAAAGDRVSGPPLFFGVN